VQTKPGFCFVTSSIHSPLHTYSVATGISGESTNWSTRTGVFRESTCSTRSTPAKATGYSCGLEKRHSASSLSILETTSPGCPRVIGTDLFPSPPPQVFLMLGLTVVLASVHKGPFADERG
jgi:hypothetical protein